MADPQTANIGIYQPTRGSDAGVWDSPVNANSGALDSLFANVATIGLTNAPVTLTTPPNSGASWAGPYQSQSALIKLTGAITANCAVTIPRAGYYIFWNQCTSGSSGYLAGAQPGSFYVTLTGGAGKVIGVPPGKKCHVFFDGTDMDFVNVPDPGTAYDLHGLTALPSWMTACTVLPYLIKDGTIYNNSAYPNLASYLLNTFGGTLGLTFAVPDELARARVGYDTTGTGRLTTAISGVNGQTMGSAGGDQNMFAHTHANTVNDPEHFHSFNNGNALGDSNAGQGNLFTSGTSVAIYKANTTAAAKTNISVTIDPAGAGVAQNVQPSIVSFLPLIKT